MSNQIVIVGRDPAPRQRLAENKPEERRALMLTALQAVSAAIERADPSEGAAALELAVALGVISEARLDFLRTAHGLWRAAPSPEAEFTSAETVEKDGLVPTFFIHEPAATTDLWARRLAWHATDIYTPIYADVGSVLADDAAVCVRATEALLNGGHTPRLAEPFVLFGLEVPRRRLSDGECRRLAPVSAHCLKLDVD